MDHKLSHKQEWGKKQDKRENEASCMDCSYCDSQKGTSSDIAMLSSQGVTAVHLPSESISQSVCK